VKLMISQGQVWFLRCKLQNGLLNSSLKEDDMNEMSSFLGQLEDIGNVPQSIISATKIDKVLRHIERIDKIPKDAEFQLKQGVTTLLRKWDIKGDAQPTTSAAHPLADNVQNTPKASQTPVSDSVKSSQLDKRRDLSRKCRRSRAVTERIPISSTTMSE
jgi:hypothetical protein